MKWFAKMQATAKIKKTISNSISPGECSARVVCPATWAPPPHHAAMRAGTVFILHIRKATTLAVSLEIRVRQI
jgi:hypothetical protein